MRSNGLAAGENLALVGSELIQFGEVTALGNGRFRLRHLLRGRAGTEWASATHSAGELFCLIRSDSLQTQIVPAWVVGAVVSAEAASGQTSVTFGGQSLRPPSPVNVSALSQSNFSASG